MTKQKYINPPLSDKSFLRLAQILKLIPIGRSTWWLWVQTGKAPQPVKLGKKTTVWLYSEIERLLDEFSNGGAQ